MKIIFICEASLEIGTGHVMRCMALANNFKDNGDEIIFATSNISVQLIKKIKDFKIIDPIEFEKNPQKCDLIIKIEEGSISKIGNIKDFLTKNP